MLWEHKLPSDWEVQLQIVDIGFSYPAPAGFSKAYSIQSISERLGATDGGTPSDPGEVLRPISESADSCPRYKKHWSGSDPI